MAEIFRQTLPGAAMPITGERLVPGTGGEIETEHLHRYLLARDLCRGRHVLDVASGEGYGSALLAQAAASVIGVDLDPATVAHAAQCYRAGNLRYLQADATALPIGDGCVDAVVSFETLEHFTEHARFLAEIRRVLRPDGFLLISTPDSTIYSAPGTPPNPFHARELTGAEFAEFLGTTFRSVRLYGQRIVYGSAIVAEKPAAGGERYVYERRDLATYESHAAMPRARYLLAVASDATPPAIDGSLYFDEQQARTQAQEAARLADEIAALRQQSADAEALLRQQAQQMLDASRDLERAHALAGVAARRVAELETERDAVLNSSTWRATRPVRAIMQRLPGPLRRGLAVSLRAAWRVASLRTAKLPAPLPGAADAAPADATPAPAAKVLARIPLLGAAAADAAESRR